MNASRNSVLLGILVPALFLAGCGRTQTAQADRKPTKQAAAQTESIRFVKNPDAAPGFQLNDLDGKPVSLAAAKGKIVLLNFWATWCAPCVKEMPSLDRLQAELGKDKFVVLPLSLDGPSRPKVAPFYQDKKLTNLGVYFDKGRKAMQALNISILPTSILIDAQGRELGRLEGEADWEKPEALALVKAAVG
jgi:thiol-disulfide isomerase/thioredoxin